MDDYTSSLQSPFPIIVSKGGLEGMLSSSIISEKEVLFKVAGGMMEATTYLCLSIRLRLTIFYSFAKVYL